MQISSPSRQPRRHSFSARVRVCVAQISELLACGITCSIHAMVNYFRFVGFYMFEVKRLGVGKSGHSNC